MLEELLAPPSPQAPQGFTARVIIQPGDIFYDPLYIVPHGNEVWISDDGGQKGDKGSQVVAVDRRGRLKRVLVPIGSVTPIEGMDVAPPGYGIFAGQIFTASQGAVDYAGSFVDTIVHRIDPKTGEIRIFCTLPRLSDGIDSGWPSQAVFGPPGGPFAGKFFAVAGSNHTVYQVTPDGRCQPFVTLSSKHRLGRITFTPDGKEMLASTWRGGVDRLSAYRIAAGRPPNSRAEGGAVIYSILRISAEGQVQDKPLAEISQAIGDMKFAPEGFGAFAGQIFFTLRSTAPFIPGEPRPLAQPIKADGAVYRLTPEGKAELFVSGLRSPATLTFTDSKTLWVGNEEHQFYQRELPDGAIVEIKAQ